MPNILAPIENLVTSVIEFPWMDMLIAVRIFFIFFDVVLLLVLFWLFTEAYELRPHFLRRASEAARVPVLDQEKFSARWARIVEKAFQSPPQSLVLGVIEADKCVDDALKGLGLEGEHMADRLEQIRAEDYPSLDRLWRAHRVRNELVHTPDFGIDAEDAKDILAIYEKFLKELGALPS